ncbi:MAG: hypothetical protein GY918_08340 [Gammaproteobacteria bacterium]|nr:hypothetical protein [Gammaproteobacteria bacterium]
MGLESSTYIDGLVSTNPLGTDNRNQGDDHIRLIKSTIKASFPDVNDAALTIHNGGTAPTAKQTGTIWRDTGNSLWKFYNGTGWITLPFAFNTSNSVDINAGTIDGVTIGGTSAPTVTDLGSVAACDINGGTIDGVTIGGAVAPTVTNIDINGGSVDGVTAGTNSAITELQVDNINVNGNAITSTDSNGDVTITPNGTGEIVLDGQKWPQADGSNTDYLTTDGAGQIAWTTNTVVTSENNAAASATTATAQAVIATAKAVLTAADVVSTNADVVLTNADVVSTNADVVSTNADVVSATAATGAVAFKFTYDSTTSMANPTGTGGVRFDNATLASVTNIAFDAVTADTGNPDISPLLLSIDDGSNDTHEGYIFIRKSGDLSTYIAFNVTGTVVDNTSWLQVPVTHSSSSGSISNGDTFYMSFVRSGNVGATGTAATIAVGTVTGNTVSAGGSATAAVANSGSSGSATFDFTFGIPTGATGATGPAGPTTPDDNSVTGAKIAMGSDAQGDVLYYGGTDYERLGAGTSGYFLKTQGAGANPAWAEVDALPTQTSHSGKYLTTNGSAASWATLDTDANTTTKGLYEHEHTIDADYSISSGSNALSAGPITINTGYSVTIPTGSTWVIA